MRYTIEQINKAWIDFNKPKYFMYKREIKDEELAKGIIEYSGKEELQIIQRQDFISYLISYFSSQLTKKTKGR